MNQPPKATDYLTLQDAATVTGVAYSTIRYWITTGKIPVYGRGNVYRVLLSDLLPRRTGRKHKPKPAATT